MRRAAKVDTNHRDIVRALESCGVRVQSLAAVGNGCPDLLVGLRGKFTMLEIKDGSRVPSQQRLGAQQVDWHQRWLGFPVYVVRNEQEALASLGITSVSPKEYNAKT
ncbi:MAG: hypothetical protein ACREXY_13285 [Gammaproteobacteria bacterium]